MADLTDIKTKLDAIQNRLAYSVSIANYLIDDSYKHGIIASLSEAKTVVARARINLQKVISAPPLVDTPSATTQKKVTIPLKKCRLCWEYVPEDQFEKHMLKSHDIDIYDNTRGMARVAAELQQRDHDLYRDD